MPLALMLGDIVGKFSYWIQRLEKWNHLVSLEELLVQRARSAFLVHWFGPGVPLEGPHLRVYILNFTELQKRFQAVTRKQSSMADKPSLLEPAAGFAGTLLGMMSAPINSVFLYEWADKVMQEWYTGALAALNTVSLGFLGSGLALLAGAGSLFLIPGATQSSDVKGILGLLQWITPYAMQLRGWWLQISGPRDKVQNPILKQALLLGDEVAKLLPFVIGFAAILFARIGKLIQPLWDQAQALIEFAKFMVALIKKVVLDTKAWLLDMFKPQGERSLLQPFVHIFLWLGKKLLPLFDKIIAYALEPLPMLIARGKKISAWWDKLSSQFESRFVTHGLPKFIETLTKRLKLISKLWHKTEPPPTPPSTAEKVFDKIWSVIKSLMGPSKPFPKLELPDVTLLERLLHKPALGFSEADIRKEAKKLRKWSKMPHNLFLKAGELKTLVKRPVDIFGREQKKLEKSVTAQYPGLSVREAIAKPYQEESALRKLLFETARRVLEPDLAVEVLKLEPLFQKAEKELHIKRLPVKQVKESKEVRPLIRKLAIRMAGGTREALEKFSVDLQKALQLQKYEVATP